MKRTRWSRFENLAMAAVLALAAFILPRMWQDLITGGHVWFRGVTLDYWPGMAVLCSLTFLTLSGAGIWAYSLLSPDPEPPEPRTDPVRAGRRRQRVKRGRPRS
jgi:hypothetical protein